MSSYLGELAALGTSVCFAIGSTLFALAGRELGSLVVNRIRLVMATLLLVLAHWWLLGSFWPPQLTTEGGLWLALSGIIGLVIGDAFLFKALVLVGPRLPMLMMSLAPVFAALQAWLMFNEVLSLQQMAGILVTLAGIGWVVMDGNGNLNRPRHYGRGILFGLFGAIGQASGLVLAKNGLPDGFSAISANLVRMLAAAIALWSLTLLQRQFKSTITALIGHWKGLGLSMLASIFGPVVGVSLALFSIQHAPIGIASTLMALPPVLLLPVGYFVFKERFGWGAVAGTLLAMFGVGLLFLM
ncbi:MAG TPA: DMT family transporter [Gammaproteobacteria bacterium]|nr:DMT family transporter [Gammaproteobacteria bacterium]